jgi:hypothetical protein
MTHLATLTLDETHNPHLTEMMLRKSGRLDSVHSSMVRKMICLSLGEYLREIKDNHTTGSRPSFQFHVTDDDLDGVVAILQHGLSEYM